ncbi:MAG: hypothetical protein EPO32_07220 [Anaerolineae bacterium]|nr:MAG: hypothetical protein EPO32_07220 [Anaerolineae bacterium]
MVTRREFLKLTAAGLASLSPLRLPAPQASQSQKSNILILVFDALSARHIQLFGYSRQTMPNLTRFADRATVFHQHTSAGSFTTSGVASMLTGRYPWAHRAIQPNGTVLDDIASHNLFSLLAAQGFTTLGFSHNLLANILLYQFRGDLREFMLPRQLALVENTLADRLFWRDYGVAVRAEETALKPVGQLPNSLLLAALLKFVQSAEEQTVLRQYRDEFPRGLPTNHDMLYRLEDYIDWTLTQAPTLRQPYAAYVHFMPPHDPYNPRREFIGLFEDGYRAPEKPLHFFQDDRDQPFLDEKRTQYDEFVAYADAEFGRLVDGLEQQGALENTWLVFTADHGEMFERGIYRHITPTLYEPVIHVPFLIRAPGQGARRDVYVPTSGVDLLPTLASAAGLSVPGWVEGLTLLDSTGAPATLPDRPVFSMDFKSSSKSGQLLKGTASIRRGDLKLTSYWGYDGYDGISELYDLAADPEELNDLALERSADAAELTSELSEQLSANTELRR